MKTRVFRAGKGDSLLLTSEAGGNILIDGGVLEAYEDHLARYLGNMNEDGEILDLVCVSHIDRDHIGGILRLLDNEVAWRVFEVLDQLPSDLKPKSRSAPSLKRPPAISAMWHNAFFEDVRKDFINTTDGPVSSIDLVDLLTRSAGLYAGARGTKLQGKFDDEPIDSREAASRTMFLGQSVGDAIELSRRIGPEQLGIPLNSEYNGDFVLRGNGQNSFQIAGFDIHVLGPTANELDALVATWNEWLNDKAGWLKKLIKKHEKDAERLTHNTVEEVLDTARRTAIEFAGNQTVTPPNLASIIMLVEDGNDSILLTGDADDASIISGLEDAGHLDPLDPGSRYHVDIFKVPHHGAHNSYSNELARRVSARHYVFCGDGAHENPEHDVLEDYLETLYEGTDGHDPVFDDGDYVTFWFNCSEKLAPAKYKPHWVEIDRIMKQWRAKQPRFRYKYKTSGQVFTVR